MMRRIQLLLGIILAAAAVVGVLFLGKLNQPTYYDVVVVVSEVPAFTQVTREHIQSHQQVIARSVAEKYVLADEWLALEAEGVYAVENLHPGQPLLREEVASGAEAEGLTRLAVALDDPDKLIVSIPVDPNTMPSVVPGDVVALFFSVGQIRAGSLVSETVAWDGPTPTPEPAPEAGAMVTTTTEADMPMTKWIGNGVVYHLNRPRRENPNYGVPGMEHEPRYIEGSVVALDIVVDREEAEWVVFALAHGQIQVNVVPAVARPDVEEGTFPAGPGVTWTDWNARFWEEREQALEAALP